VKKNIIKRAFECYLSLSVLMLFAAVLIRIFETMVLASRHGDFFSQLLLNFYGLGFDILFFCKISLIFFPIYLLLHSISNKFASWFFRAFFTLVILSSLAMIMYFAIAGLALDNLFFDYSAKELLYVVNTSQTLKWWEFAGLFLIPILFFISSFKKFKFKNYSVIICLLLTVFSLFVNKIPDRLYDNQKQQQTIDNKYRCFLDSVKQAVSAEIRSKKINSKNQWLFHSKKIEFRNEVDKFHSYFPNINFVDNQYPFLHYDESPDVLSSFFNLKEDTMPNFVFVIVEGLGREVSGYNSAFPSATPYLDSLVSTGLSWSNCFSSSQRTICVLPTLFANLPFGNRGFTTYKNDYPDFNSLLTILHDNGYYSSFFYGGLLCFDDICYFLAENMIDNYLDISKYENSEMKNSWGLYDHCLFEESLKTIDFESHHTRVDVFMTLSTHDPFEYPDKDAYTQQYTQMLHDKNLQNSISQSQYKEYASYLYLDNSLRKLMSLYASKPDFDNTIFIITGDHCFNPVSTNINKYYVPLVIWSPMINTSQRFPAVVTHRDVTPSILAMLGSNFKFESPEEVAWINSGLDTSSVFRSTTFTPQLHTSRNLTNFIYHNYFIDDDEVYEFNYDDEVLTLKRTENEDVKELMRCYKDIDLYIMNNNAIIKKVFDTAD